MEGNDFILFKHGCGNDSTYLEPYEIEFNVEAKARFEKLCENTIFYHVEVEFIGNQSFLYERNPEDDSNPIIFKIRNATLLDWSLTANGKEEIWFYRAPEITLKTYRKKQSESRSGWYTSDRPRRDDLKRKITIQRKINPSDCNFKQIGNQNLFLNWGIFAENFPEEILQDLHSSNPVEAIVNIRKSHLYKEYISYS